eukprot:482499_1
MSRTSAYATAISFLTRSMFPTTVTTPLSGQKRNNTMNAAEIPTKKMKLPSMTEHLEFKDNIQYNPTLPLTKPLFTEKSHENDFFFTQNDTLYLQSNDNKWKKDWHNRKNHLYFHCTNKHCNNFIKTDKQTRDVHITAVSQNECVHPGNLSMVDWFGMLAKQEMQLTAQHSKARDAYENYCLSNPEKAVFSLKNYYQVKPSLFRAQRKGNTQPETPKNGKQFTHLLLTTNEKWNYWMYQKKQHENIETKKNLIDYSFNQLSLNALSIKEDVSNINNTTNDLKEKMMNNQNLIAKLQQENEEIAMVLTLRTIPSEYFCMFYQGNDGTDDFQCFWNKYLLTLFHYAAEHLYDGTFGVTPRWSITASNKQREYKQLIHGDYRINLAFIDLAQDNDLVDDTVSVIYILCKNKTKKK